MKKLIWVVLIIAMFFSISPAYADPAWYQCTVKNAGENMLMATAVVDVVAANGTDFTGVKSLSLSPYSNEEINRVMATVLTAISTGKNIWVAFDPAAGSVVVPLAIYVKM